MKMERVKLTSGFLLIKKSASDNSAAFMLFCCMKSYSLPFLIYNTCMAHRWNILRENTNQNPLQFLCWTSAE